MTYAALKQPLEQLLAAAARAAAEFDHNYIGTEHLLLALSREEQSEVAATLRSFCVTPDRGAILATVGPGHDPRSPPWTLMRLRRLVLTHRTERTSGPLGE